MCTGPSEPFGGASPPTPLITVAGRGENSDRIRPNPPRPIARVEDEYGRPTRVELPRRASDLARGLATATAAAPAINHTGNGTVSLSPLSEPGSRNA
ncbi:hypothetical protein nbrc107696_20150 [Gordonia spumicola]|uniref:Uncharacterized protein n=1 Tax=Gordonia spumicola TaxID=589161 RepID=A0A7I9V8F5_9ACTN|nr:hypothetical protein nbrc107696_20150 [Gordonia spumicola]